MTKPKIDVKKEIKGALQRTVKGNASRTEKYKAGILVKLNDNLNVKKQSIEDNQGLITRYKSAKPKELTQMQQALADAV